jgi:putative glutamine amidotransferase
MKIEPRIGVTTGTTKDWQASGKSYDSYADAVMRAGGHPIRFGPDHDGRLEDCCGLLITGGNDVHPRYYPKRTGDENLSFDELEARYHMKFDELRDDYELTLVRRAVEMGVPILGICRGFQLINVVLGGRLVPDVQTCIGDAIKHKSGIDGVAVCHDVNISSQSKIEKLLPGPILHVNSYHHQGVIPDGLAPGLRAVAVSPDGLIEAYEGIDHPWFVAVQWHPEKSRDTAIYEACSPLFSEFVRQAGIRHHEV